MGYTTEDYLNLPYDKIYYSVRKATQELRKALEPLQHRRFMHFNFSGVLLADDGPFDPEECLDFDFFSKIASFHSGSALVGLWQQCLSVMQVAAERCRETVSPKAQLSLVNGLILLSKMMNLLELVLKRQQDDPTAAVGENEPGSSCFQARVEAPSFSAEFQRQMMRLILQTGDEKVYHPRVVYWSNRLLAYLLKSPLYGPVFLGYLFSQCDASPASPASGAPPSATAITVFQQCYPRLLAYEVRTDHLELKSALTFVYTILWSLLTYNDYNNVVRPLLADRTDEKKLINLLNLLMLHVERASDEEENGTAAASKDASKASSAVAAAAAAGSTPQEQQQILCTQALQLLVYMCMFNAAFRKVFSEAQQFEKIWTQLFGKCQQNIVALTTRLAAEQAQSSTAYALRTNLLQTHLIVKLVYVMFHNEAFRLRMLDSMCIEKQEKTFWETTVVSLFRLRKPDLSTMINNGEVLTITSWLIKMMNGNVKVNLHTLGDMIKVLSFGHAEVSHCLVRVLGLLVEHHWEVMRTNVERVKGFHSQLLSALHGTWQAILDESIPNMQADELGLETLQLLREYSIIFVNVLQRLLVLKQTEVLVAERIAEMDKFFAQEGLYMLFEDLMNTIIESKKKIAVVSPTMRAAIERNVAEDVVLLDNLKALQTHCHQHNM